MRKTNLAEMSLFGMLRSINVFTILLAMSVVVTGISLFTACGDLLGGDDDEYMIAWEDSKSTETTAAFDSTYCGLYKGIIVGPKSSGTVKIEINHGNDETKAYITIGGKTDVLYYTRAWISENNQNGREFTPPETLPVIKDSRTYATINFKGAFSSFEIYCDYAIESFYPKGYDVRGFINSMNIEGYDNLSVKVLKESSDNVVKWYEGTCDDVKGNKGVYTIIRNNDDVFSFLRGEGEGMYIDSFPGFYLSDGWSESGMTELNEVMYAYQLTYKVSIDSYGGTWKTTWPGGSNSGTFTCNVPLRKE